MPGAADVKADYQANIPTLTITARPDQLARYGIEATDVMDTVSRSAATRSVRFTRDGRGFRCWSACRNRGDRTRTCSSECRSSRSAANRSRWENLADIRLEESPPGIEHEAGSRRTFISGQCAQSRCGQFRSGGPAAGPCTSRIATPATRCEWGGDFENLRSASLRLALITPFVLLLIWMLLYTSFKSVAVGTVDLSGRADRPPRGGIFALAIRGMPFSISAGVGFIALFGVAVLNGLVWVSGAEHLRADGMAPSDRRLRNGPGSYSAGADDRPGGQPGVPADGHVHYGRSRDSASAGHRRDRRPRNVHPADRASWSPRFTLGSHHDNPRNSSATASAKRTSTHPTWNPERPASQYSIPWSVVGQSSRLCVHTISQTALFHNLPNCAVISSSQRCPNPSPPPLTLTNRHVPHTPASDPPSPHHDSLLVCTGRVSACAQEK